MTITNPGIGSIMYGDVTWKVSSKSFTASDVVYTLSYVIFSYGKHGLHL